MSSDREENIETLHNRNRGKWYCITYMTERRCNSYITRTVIRVLSLHSIYELFSTFPNIVTVGMRSTRPGVCVCVCGVVCVCVGGGGDT